MRTQLKAGVAGVVLSFLGVLVVPAKAETFPFEPTPEGFISHLKGVEWESGNTFVFFNPRRCGQNKIAYGCYFDYEETSSLGRRTCIYALMVYTTEVSLGNSRTYFRRRASECGPWQKIVVETPPKPPQTPPDPTPLPPVQPAPKPRTADNPTLTREQIAIGGGTLFIIGGIFGGAIGFAAAKGKNPWNEV